MGAPFVKKFTRLSKLFAMVALLASGLAEAKTLKVIVYGAIGTVETPAGYPACPHMEDIRKFPVTSLTYTFGVDSENKLSDKTGLVGAITGQSFTIDRHRPAKTSHSTI